jgi:hypothetical protein
MSAKPQDMTLIVTVTVTGTVTAANQMTIAATFAMATCVPPAPPSAAIVTPDGDIYLASMTGGTDFTAGTDIYFVLEGTVTGPTGAAFPVFFQPPASRAVTITVADDSIPGINPILPGTGNTTMLLLDDLDLNADRYNYTLNVLAYVNSGDPAKTSIDPAIVNRGGGAP